MISISWFIGASAFGALGRQFMFGKVKTKVEGVIDFTIGSALFGIAIWMLLNGYQVYSMEQITSMLGV